MPEEPSPPQCLPPKQIINGKCQFLQATTFRPSIRPFFTTSTTPAPPTATVPRPEGLPTPTYPKEIEPLPTLPPKIAEQTFINPPLITNTFSVSYIKRLLFRLSIRDFLPFLCSEDNGEAQN